MNTSPLPEASSPSVTVSHVSSPAAQTLTSNDCSYLTTRH